MKEMEALQFGHLRSPLGSICFEAQDDRLTKIHFFEEDIPNLERIGFETSHVIKVAIRQFEEYFERKRYVFDLPYRFSGTEFQVRVWQELCLIPYGKTSTYLDIARKIGNIGAIRAVGGAVGRNPLAILIPCHRIIGSNRSLVGYSGGLDRKLNLLKHEGALSSLF